jgi:hypothetical protein
MDCDAIRKKLAARIEGDLSQGDEALVSEHLAVCPQCRETYSDLQKTLTHLKSLEEIEPPEWLTQKVMARVREEARKKEAGITWLSSFRFTLPLGAVATVLIAVVAIYIYRENRAVTTVLPVGHPEALMQPYGQQREAELKNAGAEPPMMESSPKHRKTRKRERPAASLQKPRQMAAPILPADKRLEMKGSGEESGSGGNVPSSPYSGPAERRAGMKEGYAATPETAATAPGKGAVANVTGSAKAASPAPPLLKKEEEKESSEYDAFVGPSLTLTVGNVAGAREKVKKMLARMGAQLIHEESVAGRISLVYEVDHGKVQEIKTELGKIGELQEERALDNSGRGKMKIVIEIREKSGRR